MSIETNFTAIPDYWMRRPDINPPLKLMVGRLFTLSNIPKGQPEISASGLAEQTGFSWDSADRVVKKLERSDVLKFKEKRRIAGGYPFKVYSINRPKLLALMESAASADGGRSSASGGCSHPLAADMASAESGLKEEEKECTRKNTGKKGHPETLTPLAKPPVDKFDKFILPEKLPAVSGTGPEPIEKAPLSISGETAKETTPAADSTRRPNDSGSPTEGENNPEPSLTVPSTERLATGSLGANVPQRLPCDPELWACWCKVWAVHKAAFDGLADERKSQMKAEMWELTKKEFESAKSFDRSFIPDSIFDRANFALARRR